ncbi:MAG: hypothetical protein E3J87_01140 [Candidatus Cloacimonadota bacterium]|nr:MAG: hypothetical protein E3J87_01140 [Candidatus Cloacimonadota bacterium]
MEWLLFAGLILVMSIFSKVPQIEEGIKLLNAIKIPIGVVVFFVGLSSFDMGGRYIPGALMGLIAGTTLLFSLFKLIPKADISIEKVSAILTIFELPIGILSILAAFIAMF